MGRTSTRSGLAPSCQLTNLLRQNNTDGLELGRVCAPLLAQRWEEGWHWPLAQWREQLGIAALVQSSPFAAMPPSPPADA
jgi:ubiquinone biosynthesis protein Coq4